ncbi:MAG: hypothetical protein RR470_03935 [Vagococcus sp.]|uniref:hypothetical protein n=1 Tax=Vagococcus sp. TaxID=1933889 RepID=UPI002FCC6678
MYLKDIVANYLPNIKVKNNFLVIGITGNIASGKSTFADYLRQELLKTFPDEKIEIISTDDFLFSNSYLHQHNLFDKKGWEQSYDIKKIDAFFDSLIKKNYGLLKGRYSQKHGDMMENIQIINQPTVLILEGTMALTAMFSRFINYSIYLEVDLLTNYNWFKKRSLENLSSKIEYQHLDEYEAINVIYAVWEKINIKTFYKYIEPNKNKANLCIELDANHQIKYYNERKFDLICC